MKNVFLTITFSIINVIAFSQTEWAYQTGGGVSFFTDADAAYSIDVDADGNSYVTGYFNGDSDFDNTIDVDLHTSVGQTDVFVVKLNSLGELIWAKTFGGTADDNGYTIKVDGEGSVLVAGLFSLTCDFDPGESPEMRTSNGSYDAFLLKLDADGNFVWVNTFGGNNYDKCNAIVVDENSNIYLAGSFQEVVDFDQSNDVEVHAGSGAFDFFVMKVNQNGSFGWVKTMGSTLYDNANSIEIDANNNFYITGEFCNTVDFNPGSAEFLMVADGSSNAFVLKLDSLGEFVWSKSFQSNAVSVGHSITVGNLGETYVVGAYQGELDYDSGVDSVLTVSNGGWDMFVVSLDSNGNYVWGKSFGGVENGDRMSSVSFDQNSMSIFATGYFRSPVDFDPGPDEFVLSPLSNNATLFILKLNLNGDFSWVKTIASQEGSSAGIQITIDNFGNLFLGGSFGGTVDFGMDQTSFIMTSVGTNDVFALKLGNTTGIEEEEQESFTVYPNPCYSELMIEYDYTNDINCSIVNAQGKIVSSFTITSSKTMLDVSNLSQGIYFVNRSESDKTIKLIKN
jgi:Secretion system C-terminal sorting domain/Beta-propeller repeat